MALYGLSLNAVTTTGAGVAIYTDEPKIHASLQVSSTGAPASFSVTIEYTLNGTDWIAISGLGGSGMVARDIPASIGIRANLTSLSGGTSPTITAWVGAA